MNKILAMVAVLICIASFASAAPRHHRMHHRGGHHRMHHARMHHHGHMHHHHAHR